MQCCELDSGKIIPLPEGLAVDILELDFQETVPILIQRHSQVYLRVHVSEEEAKEFVS